jgi:vitamin B12 transporter
MRFRSGRIKYNTFLTFRKWGRKNYSLFSIIGKVLKISVLPVIYLLSVPALTFALEQDTTVIKMQYDLEEVEVTASRIPLLYPQIARMLSVIEAREIERSPAGSIQDLLQYVAGVDIRQRGPEGVQADISIRGGTFDQTLILLNGINITDPQTGHHNLNLPVSLSQIERIEILEGPAARVYGPNAFSGAINIVTRKPKGKSVSAQFETGSFNYFNTNLAGTFQTGNFSHLLAGNRKTSEGYTDNTDFTASDVFYSGELNSGYGKMFIQGGISDKGFGANSFYTPVFPNQYEEVQTLFSSIRFHSKTKIHLTPAIYWRRHSDKFMLFRGEAPSWYKNHNFHRSESWGGDINSWFLWTGGKTSAGASIRSESILSNVLGEEMTIPIQVRGEDQFFTHSKSRRTASFFLEHVYSHQGWIVSAGALGNYISDQSSGINFFPGLDLSYQFHPSVKMIASWNSSLRMPTFTDLYYQGPTNIGNPELRPEKSATLEGGIKLNSKFAQGHTILFHRRGIDLIDWVKSENETLWRSMNHTEIISKGMEINLLIFPDKLLNPRFPESIGFRYMYNNQQKEEGSLISYYVLDNLRHKFVASLNQHITKKVSMDLRFIYQDRDGSYNHYENGSYRGEIEYPSFWLADVKAIYQSRQLKLFISVNNIFNHEYFDIGNVVQPGRWIKSGISYHLNFN